MSSLLKITAKGITWTTLSSIMRSVVGLVQITILTRILTVSDFGTIAIANVFLVFTQLFMDLGISVGIMHRQNITKNEYSSLYWINIFMGTFLTVILIIISPIIAGIYKDESLTPIIMLLSLNILFASVGSQHRTIQSKELRFMSISLIDIFLSLISLFTAVILARKGYGVYSLVYASLFSSFLSSSIYLVIGLIKDKNIRFHFNLKETLPFLQIGSYQLGSAVMDYFSREIDIMFIGSAYGKEVLGIYSLCKKIVLMLYATINPIFTKVLTPLLAKLQSGKDYLKSIYLKIVESLSIINFPIYILIAVFSYGILFILYGEKYTEGYFLLTILALNYGLLTASNPVGSLQVALGRTDIGFYWTIYRIISTLIIIFIASFFNIEVLVVLFLLLSMANTVLIWRMQILVMTKIPAKKYFLTIIKPLSIAVIIALPFYIWASTINSLSLLIILSLIYTILYSVVIVIFMRNTYIVSTTKNILSNIFKKRIM